MWPFGRSAQARLEQALAEHTLTAPLGLQVEVKKKVAHVRGNVPNDRFPGLIDAIAGGIHGIDSVDVSGIVVAEPAPAAPPADGAKATGGSMGAGATLPNKAGAPQAAAPAVGKSPAIGKARAIGKAPAFDKAPAVAKGPDMASLAKSVHDLLRADSKLADNPVDVVQRGTDIVLRGAVDSDDEVAQAKALAAGVPGVTGVDVSDLQVVAGAAKLNVTDDDGDIVYTVKSGDTLSHIALHYYGSAGRSSFMKIAEANGIADANKIRVGQKLKIPGTAKGPEATLG